jgi:hypothetical protein
MIFFFPYLLKHNVVDFINQKSFESRKNILLESRIILEMYKGDKGHAWRRLTLVLRFPNESFGVFGRNFPFTVLGFFCQKFVAHSQKADQSHQYDGFKNPKTPVRVNSGPFPALYDNHLLDYVYTTKLLSENKKE